MARLLLEDGLSGLLLEDGSSSVLLDEPLFTFERQVPGGSFVNEIGRRQAQIPGGPFVYELALLQGTLAATEGSDSALIFGKVVVTGYISAIEADSDELTGIGVVIPLPGVIGSLVAIESDSDSLIGTGSVLVSGVMTATETSDVLSIIGYILLITSADLASNRIVTVEAYPRISIVSHESRIAVVANSNVAINA